MDLSHRKWIKKENYVKISYKKIKGSEVFIENQELKCIWYWVEQIFASISNRTYLADQKRELYHAQNVYKHNSKFSLKENSLYPI